MGAVVLAFTGVTAGILLPAHRVTMCPSFSMDRCDTSMQLYLPLRFGIAIASVIPLAVIVAGTSARRWIAVAAAIVAPAGIALALVLPSSECPTQLVSVFCTVDRWGRFAIAVGAILIAAVLVAASRLPGSRQWAAFLVVLGGLAAALILPSTTGTYYPTPGTVVPGPPDHRMAWRVAFILVGTVTGALILWALRRKADPIRQRPLRSVGSSLD
jgi:hypothetical protein